MSENRTSDYNLEDSQRQDVLRASREAKRLLDDPAFKDAVEFLEGDYIRAWREGETVEAREKAHARLAALEDVVLRLRAVFDRGEVLREVE